MSNSPSTPPHPLVPARGCLGEAAFCEGLRQEQLRTHLAFEGGISFRFEKSLDAIEAAAFHRTKERNSLRAAEFVVCTLCSQGEEGNEGETNQTQVKMLKRSGEGREMIIVSTSTGRMIITPSFLFNILKGVRTESGPTL